MNEMEPGWIPGLIALGAGVLAGGWAVLALRRHAASDKDTRSTIVDLEERASHLIAQLRDLEQQKDRLQPENYAAEKEQLEHLAAEAMRQRDNMLRDAKTKADTRKEGRKKTTSPQPSRSVKATIQARRQTAWTAASKI